MQGCRVLLAECVEAAIALTKSCIQLIYLLTRDFSKELPRRIRVDFSEAVLELNGITVASQEVLEETTQTFS